MKEETETVRGRKWVEKESQRNNKSERINVDKLTPPKGVSRKEREKIKWTKNCDFIINEAKKRKGA